jgi:hypothetical protein
MTVSPNRSHYGWSVTLKSFSLGFCVFFLGSVLAAWLTHQNVHGLLAFVDNIVAGIAAGLLVLIYERWRHREVEKKLRIIQLMNHHVRNSLQVILASSGSPEGNDPPTRVQEAVRRIEWALREVLPGETELTDAAAPPNSGNSTKESAA